MKIVVTGGTGFIGRRIVAALLARDSVTGPSGAAGMAQAKKAARGRAIGRELEDRTDA